MNLAKFAHWIGGALLSFGGIALVYLPFPDPGTALWSAAIGRLVAIAGLGWIAMGVSRRVKKDSNTP